MNWQSDKDKWWNTPQRIDSIKKLMSEIDFSGARIADLACRNGFYSFKALQKGSSFIRGIDVDHESIQLANQNFQERNVNSKLYLFEEGDLFEAKTENTDIILLLGILYHIRDQLKLLRKCREANCRVLLETRFLMDDDQHPILRTEKMPNLSNETVGNPHHTSIGDGWYNSYVPNKNLLYQLVDKAGFHAKCVPHQDMGRISLVLTPTHSPVGDNTKTAENLSVL